MIEAYCKYDKEMDLLVKDVVKYTLNKYGKQLNISTLKEVEVRNVQEFECPIDGRVVDKTKIVLTSRSFELLPSYEIKRLYKNKNFRQIVCTLFHEMGHINDMVKYPVLYDTIENSDDMEKAPPSLFWTEYLAEKRSVSVDPSAKDFCEEFVSTSWNIQKRSTGTATTGDFFYLNKALPYFIVRAEYINKDYFDRINNEIVTEYVSEVYGELQRLMEKPCFDDPKILEPLYEIINKYYKKFMKYRG